MLHSESRFTGGLELQYLEFIELNNWLKKSHLNTKAADCEPRSIR